jgi:death-on-curing protein
LGGVHGENNPGGIESVIGRVQSWVEYKEVENVVLIAVFIGYSIARAHIFVDGNKRTAYTFMASFLNCTGYKLIFDDYLQMVDAMEKCASEEYSLDEFYEYIANAVDPVSTLEFLSERSIFKD